MAEGAELERMLREVVDFDAKFIRCAAIEPRLGEACGGSRLLGLWEMLMASGGNLDEGGEERLGEEGAEAEKGEAPWGGRGSALSVMMSE